MTLPKAEAESKVFSFQEASAEVAPLRREQSTKLFAQAQSLMPGGVSSPVRAFGAVGGTPVFIDRAKGSRVWDVDGNEYIDYVGSWGPAILGHADDAVLEATIAAARRGLSFGAPTAAEGLLAQAIKKVVPSIEKLRFVSSGTEACMTAIRLARGFTGREKLVKFEGNYHGHADVLLAQAGSGVATLGIPGSAGVPPQAVADTLLAPYNDLDGVARLFKQYPGQIAGVIVEAIAGNCGFIRPQAGFLEGLHALARHEGALFILDEVMTGFRVAYGGMQSLLGLKPDLTTLGKVVGGGMPLAVYGGRADVMAHIAPDGPVYQAGTLSGNPVATACGLKTLELLARAGSYDTLAARSRAFVGGLGELARKHGLPFTADCEGGMFGFYFAEKPVHNYAEAQKSAVALFPNFFKGMLDRGIYLAPSAYEAGFVSLAHSQADIAKSLEAADQVFATLKA